jgi:hypothetical protein
LDAQIRCPWPSNPARRVHLTTRKRISKRLPWTPKLVARGLRIVPEAPFLSLQSALRISTLADGQRYCWAMSHLLQATSKQDSKSCGSQMKILVECVESGSISISRNHHAVSTHNTKTSEPSVRACESCCKRWTTLQTCETWAASIDKGERVRLSAIRDTSKQRTTGISSLRSRWIHLLYHKRHHIRCMKPSIYPKQPHIP